jgi:hypothetical protein
MTANNQNTLAESTRRRLVDLYKAFIKKMDIVHYWFNTITQFQRMF